MAKQDFESTLNVLYAHEPTFADERQFASRVDQCLQRKHHRRSIVLGTFGASGVFVTLWWLTATDLLAYARDIGLRILTVIGESSFNSVVQISLLLLAILLTRSLPTSHNL